jgi:hypothetical protein
MLNTYKEFQRLMSFKETNSSRNSFVAEDIL